MKRVVFLMIVVTAILVYAPATAGATALTADVSPAALAPSQRDINIAVFVVLIGSVLVGYEKAAHERAYSKKKLQKNQDTAPRN